MNLAVVILNWNGIELLKTFLPTLVKYSSNYSIYVIDNDSTDNSLDFLKTNFPQVKIIINDKNYGFTKGYNLGLKNINEDIFCLLNSDVMVTQNWEVPILEIFKKDNNIAAVQPKILSYKNPKYFEFAGAGGGLIDSLGYPYCRGRVFDYIEKDNGQYDDEKEIFWATGACFFIRKNDFNQINGFDDNFFAHMEEIDLCWRLINNGRKIYYCGKSVVYHLGGATLNKISPEKTFLNFRNNLLMLLKNLPKYYWFPIIFIRLFLDGLAGIKFLFSSGYLHVFAIIRAHFSFYKHFWKYYKKRKPGISNFYSTQSILLDYYLFKKFK